VDIFLLFYYSPAGTQRRREERLQKIAVLMAFSHCVLSVSARYFVFLLNRVHCRASEVAEIYQFPLLP